MSDDTRENVCWVVTGCHRLANTIVRLAKAYALHLGGKVFMRIFEEDKLQHGAAPAERIVHTVKAPFSVNKENTA
jgi:hypothetical protein